ncbi:hypothetical protein BGZ98_005831 [Dissophora globulifera]|nr:hypothetical protein BGZ98_005831 [Dissophora globulifera]
MASVRFEVINARCLVQLLCMLKCRLHIEHYVFKMLMGGKMVHVPVPKDGRVIDLGCGAATWIMDMATEMTTTQFVGIDISPIFPKAIHPRNCTFYKADLLKLPEPDNSFDMVYQRSLAVAFTAELWRQALQQAFRILKPGGWFESVETDLTIQDAGPQLTLCFDYIMVSMASQNVDPRIVPSLDRIMVSVGFVEVQVKEYCVPVGEWGGKVGQVWKQNLFAALELVKPYLSLGGRMTENQAADLVQNAGSETKDYRGYQIVYVCYGRKPLS